MSQVIVTGGGMAGCAAAVCAAQAGCTVTLIERTDMLIGGAIRAGRMNTHAKFIAAEESKALGGGAIYEILESIILHRASLYGEENTYLYDTAIAEPLTRRMVEGSGVQVIYEKRVTEVTKLGNKLKAVKLDDGTELEGRAFVDSTGSSGGMDICIKNGRGCVECVYRCPTFGDRVSLAALAGVPELARVRPDGTIGSVGSGVTIIKRSLHPALLKKLEKEGQLTIPLPPEMIDPSKKKNMTAGRSEKQMEFLNLTDVGAAAKGTGLSYLPLLDLRKIPGFENAQYESPLAAGRYNRISRVAVAPRNDALKVDGVDNLFCAGEKLGISGVAEAIATGNIAGHNAARQALDLESLLLPRETALGEYIAFTGERTRTVDGLSQGYSLNSGSAVERIKKQGLYTLDAAVIRQRIADLNLTGILAKRLT